MLFSIAFKTKKYFRILHELVFFRVIKLNQLGGADVGNQ